MHRVFESGVRSRGIAASCAIVALLIAAPLAAQSKNTENTLALDDSDVRPAATLADVSWMIGSWSGEAFGGSFEEHWQAPSAGTMTGVFKLMHGGKPSMYELMMVVEEGDSLAVRLKHFNADFSAWEEKTEFVSFPLVKLTEDAAYFAGLTYRRLDKDKLLVHVAVEEESEQKLEFVRMKKTASPELSSPYKGLESRSTKALSKAEIESLRAGEGMGFAMAAELNGYPGPKHVLELRNELGLSPAQVEATERAFDVMHAAAVALGQRVVAGEQKLDQLFTAGEASDATLEATSLEIGRLRGELRAVHLKAHLRMMEVLSPEQQQAYVAARGYAGTSGAHDPGHGHHPGMHHGHD